MVVGEVKGESGSVHEGLWQLVAVAIVFLSDGNVTIDPFCFCPN